MRIAIAVRQALAILVASLLTVFIPAQSTQAPSAGIQNFGLTFAKSGWLLAGNRLFWTDSLGSSWSEITPPSATTVSTATFRADGSGWALISTSNGLSIARTTDLGRHWASSAIAPAFTSAQSFNGHASLSFADARNGFLMLGLQSSSAFRFGLLMHTTDGGATWQTLPTPPIGGDILFTDATHGFNGPGAAGDELYSTADAGTTWQRIALPTPPAFASANSTITLPIFTDTTHGSLLRSLVTEITPTVIQYQTTDGGLSWTPTATLAGAQNTLAADGSLTHIVAPNSQLTATISHFSTSNNGLVLFRSGNCADNICTTTESLRFTTDGGHTFTHVTPAVGLSFDHTTATPLPHQLPPSIVAPQQPSPDSSTVYNTSGVMGFDACSPPTTAQLQDWITSSPYRVVGIYVGGINFACKSTLSNVTSSYISTLLTQGWQIIPIWVGLQPVGTSCTGCTTMDESSTTSENSQGVSEADAAISAMAALGLGQGSTVVFDLEAYTRNTTNTPPTINFLEGWNTEVHNKGYLSAVYSSHPEFTDWYPTVLTPSMDVIWYAYFYVGGKTCIDSTTSATAAVCDNVFPSGLDISSSYWVNNHRARQNSSAFDSSYGSTTINVDEDWVDAPFVTATPNTLTVAITGSGTVTSTTITNTNSDISNFTAINCGTACTANVAPTDTITLTATPATGATFTGWSGGGCSGTGSCAVTASSSLTVTATFTATAPAPSYTASGPSSPVTIARGSSGTASLSFTLNNGWTGTFSNFTCSVSNITCSGSTVTASSGSTATAAVTIAVASTFSQSTTPANLPHSHRSPIEFAILALLLPFTLRKRRALRSISLALACVITLAMTQLITGCGGGNSSTPPVTNPIGISKTVSVPVTFTATQTGGTAATGTPVTVTVIVTE